MKSVLRCLRGTSYYGILLPKGSKHPLLECWSNTDWAGDCTKRRSSTGYLLAIAGGPVIWASRLQSCTAQSTTESEFNALAARVWEVSWKALFFEIYALLKFRRPVIFQENLGTISWTSEIQRLRKVKHVGT